MHSLRRLFSLRAKERRPLARRSSAWLAGVVIASLGSASAASAAPSADEIMKSAYEVTRVQDSKSESTVVLVDKNGQTRVRRTLSYSKLSPDGVNNSITVVFRAPADVEGTSVLFKENTGSDDDIWIYLPALAKVRRLVASSKKDSFVGTDLSYGDVMGYKTSEWTHKLVGTGTYEGRPVETIESVPRNDSVRDSVGYSKRVSVVDQATSVVLKEDLWSPGGQHVKTIRWMDVKLVDPAHHRYWPMKVEAVNLDSGHKTLIQYSNYHANVGVDDDTFTTRYLQQPH